ncbi:unnamed protein product [Miscanthus lutarioriparius]|uniref:Uncharacterized protein n=1 Tax=Miscanthus lutarioriparius TaxID=422564 RepID=A0A811MZL3_9POAL|nr:unnamed protein product [Miscanthus lutarioriparius]
MEAPGPPPPCVRLVGPALPAPPSVAPTPLPAKHQGTVISAAPARSGAAVLPHSRFVDGGGSKVSAPVLKKTRVMKKAGAVQPPRAPARSPAAPSTQASAQEAIDVVVMDDAQQLFEESPASVQETFSLPEQYTQVAGLKKKEKQKGGSKRKKSWTENFQKKKKNKGNKKNTSKPMQQEDGSHVPESQAYESISSFTQILMVFEYEMGKTFLCAKGSPLITTPVLEDRPKVMGVMV